MSSNRVTLIAPGWLLADPDASAVSTGTAVLVQDGRIREVGPQDTLEAKAPTDRRLYLPDCLLMPGWINAHQHGRGLSQIQLGLHDSFLETWIASRRGKGLLDPYAITRLAALEMLANGVTCAVHANYSYGSGDYESEVRAQLRAYDDAGMRVTMCIGLQDQGALAYPPLEGCFLNGLPPALRSWLTKPGVQAYAGDAGETIALMHRLRKDFAGHPRIRLCYGPAGPQWVSDQSWTALTRDAAEHGLGLHTHALESPAQADAARRLYPNGALRHLDALGALGARTVLAHGVWIQDEDMELLAERDVTLVRNPGCNLRMHNGIAPMARFIQQGLRVAIGSDNVTLNDDEDLLGELRLADQLAREPDWNGPPAATDTQLLRMLTSNGARAAQWDDACGGVVPGAVADLVAIDMGSARKPMLDPDMQLIRAMLSRSRGRDVRLTMVDGEVVYQDGLYPSCDIEDARAQAVASAESARRTVDEARRANADATVEHLRQHYGRIT